MACSQSRPVLIATEGALWGSVKHHGFLPRQRDRQPDNLRSASMVCAEFMPSAWFTSSTPSRIKTAPTRALLMGVCVLNDINDLRLTKSVFCEGHIVRTYVISEGKKHRFG
jgi:hypothetical protein